MYMYAVYTPAFVVSSAFLGDLACPIHSHIVMTHLTGSFGRKRCCCQKFHFRAILFFIIFGLIKKIISSCGNLMSVQY